VRETQAWLKAFGFDPGPLDGLPGSRTMAAVKRYQATRQAEENRPIKPIITATSAKRCRPFMILRPRVPPQTAVGRKKAEPFNFLPADVK